MRGLFIADFDFEDKKNRGITKKVTGMYNAFINNNIQMDLFYQKGMYFKLKNLNGEVSVINRSRYDKYNFILENILQNEYKFIFIRYVLSNYFFIEFLRKVKENKPHIKIILEFPTLPYDKEIKDRRILNVDTYFREFLKEFIDFSIVYNNVSEVFGIKSMVMGNGIEIYDGKFDKKYNEIEKKIQLIGVGNISYWHGYDRVIWGIKNYIDSGINGIDVEFLIVGEGNELKNLIKLTDDLKLNRYVKFVGDKVGEELEDLYRISDIGVGAIAWFRKGLIDGAALKNREYCRFGLPFIYSGIDMDFNSSFKYALKIEDSEERVDINKAIEFIKDIKNDPSYIDKMRKYAEKHLDWNVKIKRILNEIEV